MIREFYYKYRIFIIPVVVGLICLIVIAVVIIPQTIELFKEKDTVGTLNNRITTLNNKTTELGNLDENKLNQDLMTALTVLPTERDVPQAMAVLQNLIAKSNLSLTSTSYSTSAKASDQSNFSLTISVMGSIVSTRNFLNTLSEGSRIFKVESISLKFLPDSTVASVDLPLTVFYQPTPKVALTIDQPVAKIDANEAELLNSLSKFAFQQSIESTVSGVPMGKTDLFQ